MKWVFAILVATNAAFFGWEMTHPYTQGTKPAPTVDTPITGNVNRLLLLSEVDTSKLRERPPPSAPAAGQAPAASPQGSTESAPLASSPAEAAPPLEAPNEAAPPSEAPAKLCYSVGPLENQDQIDQVGGWLRDHGAEATLRTDERREVSLYWVYLPPFPTMHDADEQRAQMQDQGIDDIYVIPRGDMAKAISLGLYSRKSSLERRLKELRGEGYEPTVAPRYKTTTASWYDVQVEAAEGFPAAAFSQAFPDTSATATACS